MATALRIRPPTQDLELQGDSASAASSDGLKGYVERLVKLIPAEAVSVYLIGAASIKSTFTDTATAHLLSENAYWIGWTLVCLAAVVAIRAWATSDRPNGVEPEWPAVALAAASFVIWIYSLGDVFSRPGIWFGLEKGIWEPLLSSLIVLTWTMLVPVFYRGEAPAPRKSPTTTEGDSPMADNGFLEGDALDTTWVQPLGRKWKKLTYSSVDGLAVFEGCIILGSVSEARAVKQFVSNNPGVVQEGVEPFGIGIAGKQYRWPGNTIPYEIHASLPKAQRVLDSIKHWQDNTPIRFVKRDPADQAHRDYVVFRPGNGCASNVGRRGGRQDIILGDGCSTGNCIHEIGHTVGLWHEQSRSDRDQFIAIHWDRILETARHNFNQHIDDGVDLQKYDYESIMHYPRDAFSNGAGDTIEPKTPGTSIGQRVKLSSGDIAAVTKLITS